MDHVKWYAMNSELEVAEQGEVTIEKAAEVIDRYIALQSQPVQSGEESIANSLFGFCLDDKTFIEIAMESEEQYRVKFETPEKTKLLFFTIPSLYQKEIHITGRDRLLDVVRHFL
jgi:hypothetical protein